MGEMWSATVVSGAGRLDRTESTLQHKVAVSSGSLEIAAFGWGRGRTPVTPALAASGSGLLRLEHEVTPCREPAA
jgi:hypothetical protein